jgi:hypothetical protein
MPESFWFENPDVLFDGFNGDAFKKFIPSSKMNFTERLNAITRFCIYLFVLLFLLSDSDVWMYIPLIGALSMILVWFIRRKFRAGHSMFSTQRTYENASSSPPPRRRRPTYQNPLMNHLPSDYEGDESTLPERLEMQPEAWERVKKDVDKEYYGNMYRNSSDLYEQEGSKRSFYQMPSTTIPNDQNAFAKWCYRVPSVCKESGDGCVRYADPRNERRIAREEYVI